MATCGTTTITFICTAENSLTTRMRSLPRSRPGNTISGARPGSSTPVPRPRRVTSRPLTASQFNVRAKVPAFPSRSWASVTTSEDTWIWPRPRVGRIRLHASTSAACLNSPIRATPMTSSIRLPARRVLAMTVSTVTSPRGAYRKATHSPRGPMARLCLFQAGARRAS